MTKNTSSSTLTIKLDKEEMAESSFIATMQDAQQFADHIHDLHNRDVAREYKKLLNRASILVQLIGGKKAAQHLQMVRDALDHANEGILWRDELEDMRDEEGFAYQRGDTVWAVVDVVDDKLAWEHCTIVERRSYPLGKREYKLQAPDATKSYWFGFTNEIDIFLDDKKHDNLTK